MIYGRFGDPVTVQRYATLEDVRRLERRKPDKQDRQALEGKAYIIVTQDDNGEERLYHLSFLRADDGIREIMRALTDESL